MTPSNKVSGHLSTACEALAIVGPTGIGKTAVALELVRMLGGKAEILSVDSVQVYRHLDIGSAKPIPDEQARFRFHLIDLVEPDQPFTLADYQQAALSANHQAASRGNTSVLCGGTGLYFRALTQPLGLPGVPPDQTLRAELLQVEQEQGAGTLHARLQLLDAEAAARLHPNDAKRIIRALEVIRHTGETITSLHRRDSEEGQPLISCSRIFALNCERAALYERIEQRVELMMRAGFLEEVQGLRARGYSPELRAMQSLGYHEMNLHLDGDLTLDAAVAMMKQRTRQFARRQLIWFRADPRLTWIDAPPDIPPAAVAEQIAALIAQT